MLEYTSPHTETPDILIDNLEEDIHEKLDNLYTDVNKVPDPIEAQNSNYLDLVINKINNICKKKLTYGKPYVCDTLVKKAFNDPCLNDIYGTYKIYDFLKKSQNTSLIKSSGLLFDQKNSIPSKGSIVCFIDKNKNKELCNHIGIYGGLDSAGNHTIYDASVRYGVSQRKVFPYEASQIKYFTYIPSKASNK